MFELGDQGEPSSNKKTDVDTNKTSDTFFPTVKAVFDWVSGLFVKGAASSTANAIARFDGATGKVVQNSSVIITDSGDIRSNGVNYGSLGLKGNSLFLPNGSGGVAYFYNSASLTGDYLVFGLSAQNSWSFTAADSNGWQSINLQPLGGKVGIGTTQPTSTLDINGTSRFRNSATFNGQFIDNVGSSGADGQVLKKVGGKVIWSNP